MRPEQLKVLKSVRATLNKNKAPLALRKGLKAVIQSGAYDIERRADEDKKHGELMRVGKCAYESIAGMVAALECDYDRLEELREQRDEFMGSKKAVAIVWNATDEGKELLDLEDAAGECESRDEASERIQEDALSIEVRSAWHAPCNVDSDDNAPTDFNILLSTGGPATRIRGELNEHGEPTRAWLEVQDWFLPWTQYTDADQDVLLTYSRCFYFGEG